MRKLIRVLSTCVMLGGQSLAADMCDSWCEDWPVAAVNCTTGWPSSFKMDIGGGFRKDKFEWSIAGFNEIPNVLAELQWKDLRIAQVGANANYVSCRNYVLYAAAEYGRIYHGHVDDADYLSDGKTDLFSFSRNKADKGHVYDLSTAAGYRVTSTCGRFIGLVLAGYSQHAQDLHLNDGTQLFEFVPVNRPIQGLNSTYTTKWYGPWIGVDFEARVERCAFLFGAFEWHMLAYRGHGHWNLRPDIGRFDHKAYGQGYIARLGGKWEIWNRWSLGVVGSYRMFRTRQGHEHVLVHDPILGPIRGRLRFNGAQWHTYAVSGFISWRF